MTSGSADNGEDEDDLFRRVLSDAKPIKQGRPVPEHPAVKAGKKITPAFPPGKKANRVTPRPVAAPPAPKPVRELAMGGFHWDGPAHRRAVPPGQAAHRGPP